LKIFVNLLFAFFNYSGLLKLLRYLYRDKVVIVLYHNPSPLDFELHVQYIVERYNVISLSDFIERLTGGNDSPLPKNSLIITFDDGHAGNYSLLPTIIKYQLRPTIYLVSDIVGYERKFWWTVPGSALEIEELKMIPNRQRIKVLHDQYCFDSECNFSDAERQSLTWGEIFEMKDYVDFQSHTRFHPILTTCDDAELDDEILKARLNLELRLSNKVEHFAYPNGAYNKNIISRVKNFGYASARTTDCGFNDLNSDPYRLKILGVSDSGSIKRLQLDLCGFPLILIKIYSSLFRCAVRLRSVLYFNK
jgi:peptidoglycan/xylan/chitin deacetylase (PgdA/CDA1 family)